MLVVVVAGWTLGISPLFTQIAAANAQLVTTQASNQSSERQLATLGVQYKNIAKLRTQLDALRLSIPEEQAASVFINEITALGAATGVTLQTVTIATATLYAAPTAAGAAAGTTDSTSTPSPSPTAATTPTPATTTTASGLVLIPVVITVKGPFESTRLFAGALQTGERLLSVSGLSMTTDSSTGDVTATVTGNIFTMQGTSDPSPATQLVPIPTPTPTATPTVTATATPTPSATAKP
jgi:Tfp pilus assembly protein PilO